MRKFWTLAAVVLCSAGAAGCSIDVNGAGAVLTEQKTFTVTGPPDLKLHTFDGAIEVRSWDRNEVSVEIQRRAATSEDARALEVTTTQDGNRIVIDAPGRERRQVIHIGAWQGEGVTFIVRAPRQLMLDAQTGDGSISTGDLSGTITLQSGDGSIRGERLDGAIKAHTGDGSIAIQAAAGRFDLDSGDGSIRLDGRVDDLRVHTGDGSVVLTAGDGSAMKNDWSVTSGDGSISVSLPGRFDADVDAQSGDGRVRASWAPEQRSDGDGDRGTFRGRLGAGGHTLRTRSGDGSITLSSR
jgi:hypothetical protein